MNYDPAIFTRVTNLQDAKRIILTDEQTLTTDQRWHLETPHICDLIQQNVKLDCDSMVLDYGCGIGRIAKELIDRHECWVVGVDIAPNMQALAASYVASQAFVTCHPVGLNLIGRKFDLVIAVWVLQHVELLGPELEWIKCNLKTGGHLFVVNEGSGRFVPTAKGWQGDGVDVRAELGDRFKLSADGNLSAAVVGDEQSRRTFWAVYNQR